MTEVAILIFIFIFNNEIQQRYCVDIEEEEKGNLATKTTQTKKIKKENPKHYNWKGKKEKIESEESHLCSKVVIYNYILC